MHSNSTAVDSYTTRAATTSFRLATRKTGEDRRKAIAEHFKRFPSPSTAQKAACPSRLSQSMSS